MRLGGARVDTLRHEGREAGACARAILAVYLATTVGSFLVHPLARADTFEFKTRLGLGLIYPSISITRHIFESDPPFDHEIQVQRARVNAQPDPTYRKFATPFSWELGYGFLRLTEPNGVDAPVGPEHHHAYRVGLRWEHSDFLSSAIKMRFYYTPVEATQGGELEFELGSLEILSALEDVPKTRTRDEPFPALFLGGAIAVGKHVDPNGSLPTQTLLSREIRAWLYYLPHPSVTFRFVARLHFYTGGLADFLSSLHRAGPRLSYPYPSVGDEGNLWISGFPASTFRLGATHRTGGSWAFDWALQSANYSLSLGSRIGAHASVHRQLNRLWSLGVGADYMTGETFLGAASVMLSREI